jgi:hypothetical protein
MPPAGLLAIIAVGLVLAYVLPQRIRERSDYALVRTEDRYSADMRVVRASAARVTTRDAASVSTEVPLLVTGQARARVAQVSEARMSRPHGPLDRAATHAQRQQANLRRDRVGSRAERAARARRRALVTAVTFAATVLAWILAAATGLPALVAGLATGALVTVTASSARAAAAERAALARVQGIAREVQAAATATQALRVVSAARARGIDAEPSDVATQAIRIVTSADLAPGEVPALTRETAAERAAKAAAVEEAIRRAQEEEAEARADEAAGWRPRTMPVPAYALKPSVRQQMARTLSDEDYAASSRGDYRVAPSGGVQAEGVQTGSAAQGAVASEAAPTSGALDAILARRRQASA